MAIDTEVNNNVIYMRKSLMHLTAGVSICLERNESKIFQFDTWYEFTFRLTIKNYGKSNAQFKVEILVDGEAYGTSTNFYSNSIAFQTGKTVRIRFQPQMRIHALIYVDDITATLRNSAQYRP